MPQVWLTYQELGDALGCAPLQARTAAVQQAWTRKHSRDGQTRVMLPVHLMNSYFAMQAVAAAEAETPAFLREPLRSVSLKALSGRS